MRIERHPTSVLSVVAFLDETETRVLSRSLDALPDWMLQRPGASLRRHEGPEGGLSASFADEDALDAFVLRFLPGQRRRRS